MSRKTYLPPMPHERDESAGANCDRLPKPVPSSTDHARAESARAVDTTRGRPERCPDRRAPKR